jgi:hypothetical protein
MRTTIRIKRLLLAGAMFTAACTLAACGGGGSGDDTPPPPDDTVPPSALVSTQALVAFLKGLVSSDTAQPLRLDGVVPPTSDTEEPLDLN